MDGKEEILRKAKNALCNKNSKRFSSKGENNREKNKLYHSPEKDLTNIFHAWKISRHSVWIYCCCARKGCPPVIRFIAQQVGRLLLKPAHGMEFLSRVSRRVLTASWKVLQIRVLTADNLTRKQTPSNFKGAPIIRAKCTRHLGMPMRFSTVYTVSEYLSQRYRLKKKKIHVYITSKEIFLQGKSRIW